MITTLIPQRRLLGSEFQLPVPHRTGTLVMVPLHRLCIVKHPRSYVQSKHDQNLISAGWTFVLAESPTASGRIVAYDSSGSSCGHGQFQYLGWATSRDDRWGPVADASVDRTSFIDWRWNPVQTVIHVDDVKKWDVRVGLTRGPDLLIW